MRTPPKKSFVLLLVACLALLLPLKSPVHAGKKNEGGPIPIGPDVKKKSKKDGDPSVFPIVISEPGSYLLIGNLDLTDVPDRSVDAISIEADHVTLDLGGYSIIGAVTCSGTPVTACEAPDDTPPEDPPIEDPPVEEAGPGSGINACAAGECFRDTTVLNGNVRGMLGGGIKLGVGARVEKVRVGENGTIGIEVGDHGMVRDSTAERNGSHGISTSHGCQVTGSTATGNGGAGLSVGDGVKVVGNVLTTNNDGLVMGDNTGYTENVITGNNDDVVFAGSADPIQIGGNVCGNTSACP